MLTREVLNLTSVVNMKQPVVTIPSRKMGYSFLPAEAHWILSGGNGTDIIKYAPHIGRFSDDGYRFQGAYGPRVTEQLRYVCETLNEDADTRQAVINIWRENPRHSKDIPCTISLQFFIRKNKEGYPMLNCVANMRSSDIWLGWVYDVFNFSMISAWVALRLREMNGAFLGVGTLYLNAGSQHLYDINAEQSRMCLQDGGAWQYDDMNYDYFSNPGHLMNHLICLRDRQWIEISRSKCTFLAELEYHVT